MFARVFLCCFALASVAEAAELSGKLTAVEGEAFLKARGGAAEIAAKVGDEITSGMSLRTGGNGRVEARLADGSLLALKPGSSIMLSPSKRQQKKSAVVLFFGRLWSKVSPGKTGGAGYEVATPNAVCGVRGTEFETQVGDDGSLRMQVTAGKVAVSGDRGQGEAGAGEQVEANERAVGAATANDGEGYEAWNGDKRERLRKGGVGLVKSMKAKIMSRKDKIEALRAEQKDIEQKHESASERARAGDESALAELRAYNQRLAKIADEIADLGDEALAGFGAVDRFADLVSDPRFKAIGRKNIEAEAASLRRIKANLDKMVAEGTDLSIEAMDQMLDDMSRGKGTLREKKGSAGDDLFGPGEMDMK